MVLAKDQELSNKEAITLVKCELKHQIETTTLLQQESEQLKIRIADLKEDNTRCNEQSRRFEDEAKRAVNEIERLRSDVAAVLQILEKQQGSFARNLVSLLSTCQPPDTSKVTSTPDTRNSQVVPSTPTTSDSNTSSSSGIRILAMGELVTASIRDIPFAIDGHYLPRPATSTHYQQRMVFLLPNSPNSRSFCILCEKSR